MMDHYDILKEAHYSSLEVENELDPLEGKEACHIEHGVVG